MRSFLWVGGLLLGVLVLIAVIPDTVGWETPRNEHLKAFSSTAILPTDPPVSLPDATLPALSTTLPPPPPPTLAVPQLAPAQGEPNLATPRQSVAADLPETHLNDLTTVRHNLSVQPAPTPPPVPIANLDLYIHLPPAAAEHQPLRVLLVLHGMGGRGESFAQSLIAGADRNGWVIVAPNMPYVCDYLDPAQLMQEDLYLGHSLNVMLDGLPKRLGLKLRPHVLLFGFSRGAQLAHRFAMFHPDHVETVAAVSGGSYTLPLTNRVDSPKQLLAFPYGIGDLPQHLGVPFDLEHFKKISWWVAVGGNDTRSNEVARSFDAYVGPNRVERARSFETALANLGIDAHLVIFQNAGHEVTVEMFNTALLYLRKDELADNWND